MFAGVGFAIAVGLFVLWGPSPKPRKKGDLRATFVKHLARSFALCLFHYSYNETIRERGGIMQLCVIDDIVYPAIYKLYILLY